MTQRHDRDQLSPDRQHRLSEALRSARSKMPIVGDLDQVETEIVRAVRRLSPDGRRSLLLFLYAVGAAKKAGRPAEP